MAVLTLGLILGAVELVLTGTIYSLWIAAAVILVGLVVTCWRRTARIVKLLQTGEK